MAESSTEELEELLGARVDDPPLARDELDALFEGVQGRVRQAEGQPGWWWKTRSTPFRRLLAVGSFAVIAVCTGLFARRADWDVYPDGRMAMELAALAVLAVFSLLIAIRPTHQPALPRWASWTTVGLALLATLTLAVLPPPHAGAVLPSEAALYEHALPCMYVGLLLGLPVYAVARLLDRGTPLAALVAAGAAGLGGNMLLQMYCPVNDPAHNVVGHFGVAVLFVLAVALLEVLRARRRRG